MDVQKLLNQYLAERSTMQLATVDGDQPWVCTVRYVSDEQRNIYWASLPTRRHSQEVEKNSRVSCAIVVHDIIDDPVIGIQIEGTVKMQEPSIDYQAVAEKYAARFNRDEQWVDDFVAGNTAHRLYKLTPASIYLFDEKNFPGGQRQKIL